MQPYIVCFRKFLNSFLKRVSAKCFSFLQGMAGSMGFQTLPRGCMSYHNASMLLFFQPCCMHRCSLQLPESRWNLVPFLRGMAASMCTSNFLLACLMVSINSSSSGSIKKMPLIFPSKKYGLHHFNPDGPSCSANHSTTGQNLLLASPSCVAMNALLRLSLHLLVCILLQLAQPLHHNIHELSCFSHLQFSSWR